MGIFNHALSMVRNYADRGDDLAQILREVAEPPHAEIYDTTDQFPDVTDPVDVTLSEEGILHHVEHIAGASMIKFRRDGTYVIIFDSHVTRATGASSDYLDIWLELNGSPMSRTRTRKVLRDPNELDEVGFHAVPRIQAGDVIKPKMMVSSTGAGIGLSGDEGDAIMPALPSVNLKVFRVSM